MRRAHLGKCAVDRLKIRSDFSLIGSVNVSGFDLQVHAIASAGRRGNVSRILIRTVHGGDEAIFRVGDMKDDSQPGNSEVECAHPCAVDVRRLGRFVLGFDRRGGPFEFQGKVLALRPGSGDGFGVGGDFAVVSSVGGGNVKTELGVFEGDGLDGNSVLSGLIDAVKCGL